MALDWQRQKNQFTTLLSSEIVRLWFSLCCLYPMCYMCLFWVLDLFTRHWDTIKVNGYILLVHACGTLWETKSHGTVRLASGIISVRCSLLNTPQVVGTLSTIEVVPLLVIYALTVNIYIYIYTPPVSIRFLHVNISLKKCQLQFGAICSMKARLKQRTTSRVRCLNISKYLLFIKIICLSRTF